jgi:D-alanyl-lipoteichoic acid acyltransferase DltB (MBOAT superfamily)
MLFNSIHFLIFFPVVTIGFFLLAQKHRWWWLLMASCYFYMAFEPIYILILAFTIIIDYYAAIFIENSEGKRRKQWLIASLIANIGVLVVFKYYNYLFLFLPSNAFEFDSRAHGIPYLSIALPIGLSFHTFQAMSYTIEVYRGNQKAERRIGLYALFVMFYPQLVAGPIERPQNIFPQFKEVKKFDYGRIKSGLQLMAWGMFKKVVIADRLAIFVDEVYRQPGNFESISVWVATFFFTFQIYCDFSGYTDIAIGAGLVMGFRLMKNFHNPYFAKSIREFWGRWHISLSTWFRDYLYIPLGGNRVSKPRAYFNVFFVFLVSGVWHGANTNYIIWGALHGFYLIIGLMTLNARNNFLKLLNIDNESRLMKVTNIILTFLLVMIAWIAFRADYDLKYFSFVLWDKIAASPEIFNTSMNWDYIRTYVFMGQGMTEFIYAILLIVFLLLVNSMQEKQSMRELINRQKTPFRWVLYISSLLIFIYLGVFESDAQFIYFQF